MFTMHRYGVRPSPVLLRRAVHSTLHREHIDAHGTLGNHPADRILNAQVSQPAVGERKRRTAAATDRARCGVDFYYII